MGCYVLQWWLILIFNLVELISTKDIKEVSLWLCLWGCFQTGLTEGLSVLLRALSTNLWNGALDEIKKEKWRNVFSLLPIHWDLNKQPHTPAATSRSYFHHCSSTMMNYTLVLWTKRNFFLVCGKMTQLSEQCTYYENVRTWVWILKTHKLGTTYL